jgi:hypothetical protein
VNVRCLGTREGGLTVRSWPVRLIRAGSPNDRLVAWFAWGVRNRGANSRHVGAQLALFAEGSRIGRTRGCRVQ